MNADLIVQLLILAISKADAFARLLAVAKAEGRDVSDAELNSLASQDDIARAKLQADIDKGVGS
jgi:hypothetical protein